jgi:hypothetical protein
VGEVEAGAAAVQVPPVAVLLVPVALGLVRPIAGAELAEDRIRADRLLTAVRKIRRRQAAVPILGLLVRQPRRPTPRAGNSTIHETSTIRIIPLIQSGRRVEWDFRPGRLHKREANRTARGRPVLQWFWSITVHRSPPRLHRGMRGRSRPHNLPFCPTQTGWCRASAILLISLSPAASASSLVAKDSGADTLGRVPSRRSHRKRPAWIVQRRTRMAYGGRPLGMPGNARALVPVPTSASISG